MSGLVYTGDPVKAFGKFMPSLVIEKVYIYDSSLKVRTAIYLPSSTDEAPSDEYLNALESSLNFYGVMVFDASNVNAIINGSTTILSSIVNNAELITDDATFPVHSNFEQIIPNLTNIEPEIVYDNSENMLFKYSFETDIYPLYTAETFNSRLRSMSQNTLLKYGTLCCFATTYDLSETTTWIESFNNLVSTTNDPLVGHPIYLPDAPTALIKRNIGDVTYENVFINGALNEDSLVAYTTPTGEFYTGPVLKSLDGTDYEAGNIKPSDIQASMRGLLDQYSPTDVETEVELAGVANSVSYIAQTGANNSLVVSELNKVRKSFPKRGGATKTGRFYNDLSTTLSSINTKIQSNAKLKKVLYKNAKLVDARAFGTLNVGWVAPETNAELQEEVIYSNALISTEIYNINQDDPLTLPSDALNWGYFFFDMEKVLHRDTYLATLLDISKIDKLFGTALMNTVVKINNLDLQRIDYLNLTNTGVTATWAGFNNKYENAGTVIVDDKGWPKPKPIEYTEEPGEASAILGSTPQTSQGFEGAPDTSYVALRAFELAGPNGMYSEQLGHDYRLMCFEFQDYYYTLFDSPASAENAKGAFGDYYAVEIGVTDLSLWALTHLKNKLQDVVNIFQDYRDIAADYCNYNDQGGYFNSFFHESMNSTYGGNMNNAPWILSPMTYTMYRDLLDHTASKPMEQLIEDASLISEKTSPALGSLEEVDLFLVKLIALNDEFQNLEIDLPNEQDRAMAYAWGRPLSYTQELSLENTSIYVNADFPTISVDPQTNDIYEWVEIGNGPVQLEFHRTMNNSEKLHLENLLVFNEWVSGAANESRGYGDLRSQREDWADANAGGTLEGTALTEFAEEVGEWAQDKATDNSSTYDDNRYSATFYRGEGLRGSGTQMTSEMAGYQKIECDLYEHPRQVYTPFPEWAGTDWNYRAYVSCRCFRYEKVN